MPQPFLETWNQLQRSFSPGNELSAITLTVYLLLGGILALYVRFLYRRCSVSPSDSDAITRVFPLLTLVTIGVIVVVKSSMALSLGLLGALSIVRFRSTIKEPEELAYLFLCIAVGLALGADQPLLAVAMVAAVTLFALLMRRLGRRRESQSLLLTITGDAHPHFVDGESGVLSKVEQYAGRYTLQRFDLEHGRGQVRIVLSRSGPQATSTLISRLREQLPDCDFSYVNMSSTL